MVKLLRKYVYPKSLHPYVPRPPPNMYQMLWELRKLKDPEIVDEEEEEEGGGEGADGEIAEAEQEEEDDDPTKTPRPSSAEIAADKRGVYIMTLVNLLRDLWRLTYADVHQDELQAALKVAVTYPANIETSATRFMLADMLLRDASYQQALLVFESIHRDYPRDPKTFEAAYAVACLYRRMGEYQKAIDLFKCVFRCVVVVSPS